MKIVVRVPNWIGDVILALPVFDSLAAAYPGAEVWAAGAPWAGELLAEGPLGGRFIALPDARGVAGARAAARALAARRFDAGLLLTNSFGSAAVLALAGIPERWGYRRDGRAILLTRSAVVDESGAAPHMVHFYLRLLERLGIATLPPDIRLAATGADRAAAREVLAAAGAAPDSGRPLAVLNPGAGYGPAKRWPAARFGELARLFRERKGMDIAVTGAAADAPLAAEIAAVAGGGVADLTGGTTLRALLGVFARAAVVVTNDTGPMHMANALRTPVVGVFGPTEPAATAPFHQPSAVVRAEAAPCWPCLYRVCPYDHRCLTAVSAEDAFAAAAEMLG